MKSDEANDLKSRTTIKTLKGQYAKASHKYKKMLMHLKKKGNIYATLKLLLFIALACSIYYYFSNDINIVFVLIFILLYLLVAVLDTSRGKEELRCKSFVNLYNGEIKYLDGDFSSLDEGERYLKGDHHYSYDLDVFGKNSLYQEMNRTASTSGADLLAKYLESPILDALALKSRQEAIIELSDNINWVNDFRVLAKMYPLVDIDKQMFSSWASSKYDIWFKVKFLLISFNSLNLAFLLSGIFGFLSWGFFFITLIISILIWIVLFQIVGKAHISINKFIKDISNYFHLIKHLSTKKFESAELREILKILFGEHDAMAAFSKLKGINSDLDGRGNILGTLLLNCLYLRDAHMMIKIAQWHFKYNGYVEKWIGAVNKIDALNSMATYRFNNPSFCMPIISENTIISANSMLHPLIKGEEVVSNDIEIAHNHNIFIITGANMSGKSTFLRSVGLNHVLATTGNCVRCESYHFKPIDLFTSMRTTDNLSEGRSYFHTELLRLEALHKKIQDEQEVLVILDEMLKGTNSDDKLTGSRKFLIKLLNFNVSGLVATHDLKLGELQNEYPNNFFNICFEIEHANQELIYTYRLQKGVSKNMNATFLLNKMRLI